MFCLSYCPIVLSSCCPVVLCVLLSASLKWSRKQSSHVAMAVLRRPVLDSLQILVAVVDVEAVQILGAISVTTQGGLSMARLANEYQVSVSLRVVLHERKPQKKNNTS